MFYLLKKNSSYLIQLAFLLPILTLAWFIKIRLLDTFQIFMAGMWMMLAVLVGMINGEMIEKKMRGYAFLQLLPIKDREIVISKFLMAGLTACALVLHVNILFLFLSGPSHIFSLGRILIPLFAAAALLVSALLYILAYRIGFSRFFKIAWATFFLVILSPILIIEIVLPKLKLDYAQIIYTIISLPSLIWLLMGIAFLGAYLGMMALAIKAKKAGKE